MRSLSLLYIGMNPDFLTPKPGKWLIPHSYQDKTINSLAALPYLTDKKGEPKVRPFVP